MKEVSNLKNFKFINIALIVIIVILLLFGLYICVFQVSSSNDNIADSNLKTASETVKYDISETNNAIIHTRYLGNNNLFWIYVKFLDTFFENFFIFMRPLSSLYYILNLYWYKWYTELLTSLFTPIQI